MASKAYEPSVYNNAMKEFSTPVILAIPERIPVVEGNSGNHRCYLYLTKTDGTVVLLKYQGGADVSHPSFDNSTQKSKAISYNFLQAENLGYTPHQEIECSKIELSVNHGDDWDTCKRTVVNLYMQVKQDFSALNLWKQNETNISTTQNVTIDGSASIAGSLTVNSNILTGSSLTSYSNLSYGTTQNKLDVESNFGATVRCADFTMGHPDRRGLPGRALVDMTKTLSLNHDNDWEETRIGGKAVRVPGNLQVSGSLLDATGLPMKTSQWNTSTTGDLSYKLGGVSIGMDNKPGMLFSVNGSVYNHGKLGVGGIVPEKTLDVLGETRLTIPESSNKISALQIDVKSFGTPENANQSYYLRMSDVGGNTTHFVVCGNGRVGIGVANPSNALEVNGKILAEEVEVITNVFPDYVFNPDYSLMSVDSLSHFVKTNRHLPGVPKAETVIKEGMGLKEMNIILLEKVEELSLYVIEQNERIKNLEKRMNNEK